MENLGYLALVLALCVSGYAIVAAVVGKLRENLFLEVSSQRAVVAAWLLITTASGLLLYDIFTDDFRLSFVAGKSNADLPTVYKFAVWWGGQEGSLLFWTWILATYSLVSVYSSRRRHRDMIAYVVAIMMTVQVFFLILVNFVANPFQVLMAGAQITSPSPPSPGGEEDDHVGREMAQRGRLDPDSPLGDVELAVVVV